MAAVTPGGAISAALSNIEPGWRGAWGALLLVLAGTAANELTSSAAPGLLFLVSIAQVVIGTVAAGALFRALLQADHPGDPAYRPGPAGFQWTGFESRILVANIVVALVVIGVVIAVSLVWCVLLGIMFVTHLIDPNVLSEMNAVADPWRKLAVFFSGVGGVVNIVLLIAAAVGIIWLTARLSLIPITSADRGRFSFGAGWALSRGVVWPIVAAGIVIFVIGALLGAVTGLAGMIIGKGAGSLLGALLGAAIETPAAAGLAAYIYRAKREPDPAVAQVFA